MWKKVLAGISVLALVMVAFAGAVYAQAENAELRASEKIDGKIADYKAIQPEWTEKLKSPTKVMACGICGAFIYFAFTEGIPFAIGVCIGYAGVSPYAYSGSWTLPGQKAAYWTGVCFGRLIRISG